MSADGDDFGGLKDTDLAALLDEKDDRDEEEEVDTTRPFQPDAASTPYHGGEQVELQTMHHEHSGLPDTSYEETPLLGDFLSPEEKTSKVEEVKDFIKKRFPKVDLERLGPIGFGKKSGNQASIVSFGPKGGETKILKSGSSDFLKSFTDKNSAALGPRAEDIIFEDRDSIRETRQTLKEAEIQLKQAEKLSSQREEEKKKLEVLRRKIEQTDAKIEDIQDEQGSNLESEAELRRLIQLKKNHQTELENKKKELASLSKQAKSREKEQAKVDRLRASLAAKESETNAMEEKLNQTKPLDDLKERESELQRQNEEDQAIIQDENASPSDKEAAEGRVAERNEELARQLRLRKGKGRGLSWKESKRSSKNMT